MIINNNDLKQKAKELIKKGITIKAISYVSQINTGTLYKYFENKQNIDDNKMSRLYNAIEEFNKIMQNAEMKQNAEKNNSFRWCFYER